MRSHFHFDQPWCGKTPPNRNIHVCLHPILRLELIRRRWHADMKKKDGEIVNIIPAINYKHCHVGVRAPASKSPPIFSWRVYSLKRFPPSSWTCPNEFLPKQRESPRSSIHISALLFFRCIKTLSFFKDGTNCDYNRTQTPLHLKSKYV